MRSRSYSAYEDLFFFNIICIIYFYLFVPSLFYLINFLKNLAILSTQRYVFSVGDGNINDLVAAESMSGVKELSPLAATVEKTQTDETGNMSLTNSIAPLVPIRATLIPEERQSSSPNTGRHFSL